MLKIYRYLPRNHRLQRPRSHHSLLATKQHYWDAKRSVASAILVSASGVSGIYSSLTFRQQDAPNYVPGIIAVIAPFVVSFVLAVSTSLMMRRQNRLTDQGKKVLVKEVPGFRYTL
jgi:FtsH-binding integral membrane protein